MGILITSPPSTSNPIPLLGPIKLLNIGESKSSHWGPLISHQLSMDLPLCAQRGN
jgi:hypothetical protein